MRIRRFQLTGSNHVLDVLIDLAFDFDWQIIRKKQVIKMGTMVLQKSIVDLYDIALIF